MSLYLDCKPQPANALSPELTSFTLMLRGRDGTPVARKGAAEARGSGHDALTDAEPCVRRRGQKRRTTSAWTGQTGAHTPSSELLTLPRKTCAHVKTC
jgi:hypothetical protein